MLSILLILAIVLGVVAAAAAVMRRPWTGFATGAVILFVIWLIFDLVVH